MDDEADAALARQYEIYPYPPRDPREEARRLVVGSPGHLAEVDFWVFGAARPRAAPLRALFAGGGTGDGAIMLAAQLAAAGREGHVTWLDRSEAALRIARARAEARRLANISFVIGDLLDLRRSGVGPFEYVDCCGVLHHLPDPAAGLAVLGAVLAPGGGMGLMVYAPHGRTGVYMVQEALRLLAPADEVPSARLEVARRVMRHLPEGNWLHANRNFIDHVRGGDAGLYDLLLNPRDRPFTVAAFAGLIAGAGLRLVTLVEPLRYDPGPLLADPKLRARAAALDPLARAGLAEALSGQMATHIAYCTRAADPPRAPDAMAPDAVPVIRDMTPADLARTLRPDGSAGFVIDRRRVAIALPAEAGAILPLLDGKRSVGEIGTLLAVRGMPEAAFRRAWAAVWEKFSALNRVLLAAPG